MSVLELYYLRGEIYVIFFFQFFHLENRTIELACLSDGMIILMFINLFKVFLKYTVPFKSRIVISRRCTWQQLA